MKILLAVDGSECSAAAVDEIARRTWPTPSEVKIISAIEPIISAVPEVWMLSPDYFEETSKALREQAREVIEGAASKFREGKDRALKISSEIIEGTAKRVILDEAESWDADLIVVGSHGYGALNRFLLGSVSQAVALHAKCSVEIVRCRTTEESETK